MLREIKSTSKLLSQTEKNRMAELDRYVALQQQISKREELIETLNAELEYANISLERTSNVAFALEEDLLNLEKEYGILARNAYRQKVNNSNLVFLFSAVDFNQAVQRWQYLKQYNNYRERQANRVIETKQMLNEKMTLLDERKQEKEQLLQDTEEQKGLLAEELNLRSALLASLQKDEERLKKSLNKQQEAHDQLNNAIEKVIQREMLANRKRQRSREEALKNRKTNAAPSKTPEAKTVGSSFGTNRGKLPWPVSSGVIVKHFGKQPHPTLKKIQITNNGIDIQTNPNATVRAVFAGVVVGKQFVPGYDNMLIIKHGDYYTVYSNMKEVYVKKDDTVKIKQSIGVASRKGTASMVHFEVWRDKKRLNPARWITRR